MKISLFKKIFETQTHYAIESQEYYDWHGDPRVVL
jgi:hypothetical protein